MTDSGDRLAKRYREISREEPPAALDQAILAASRRAVARDSRAQRWLAPMSIAAVLVLGFGVTLQMQREEPEIATAPSPQSRVAPPPPAAEATPSRDVNVAAPPALKKEPPRRKPDATVKERAETRTMADAAAPARQAAPAAAEISTPGAAPAPAAPAAPASAAPAAAGATAMQSFARAKSAAPADLERELERIAKLRADGRAEEADKALEAFRREHPDYRIAEAMWERVKPR